MSRIRVYEPRSGYRTPEPSLIKRAVKRSRERILNLLESIFDELVILFRKNLRYNVVFATPDKAKNIIVQSTHREENTSDQYSFSKYWPWRIIVSLNSLKYDSRPRTKSLGENQRQALNKCSNSLFHNKYT